MNRAEVLEFLELPESATDHEIRVRMNDKLAYFQRLSENAPNDFLRKLHTSNTEKIRTMQNQMGGDAPPARSHQPAAYQQPAPQQPSSSKSEVAWLVRHTENQSAKTFPLYYGKNYIGRNPQMGPAIILDEDPYISRVHALLEVININPLQVVVSDDANSNGGKPSKNGTYVNGDEKRLSRRMTIGTNDTIQVGMTKLIVRLNNTSIHKIVREVEESDYMKTVVIDIF
jgi:pSer/pThr/pTyr-binding forkhead associated (FHA) protein